MLSHEDVNHALHSYDFIKLDSQIYSQLSTKSVQIQAFRGILIGYVSEITEDSNHLTKKGYIIPVVDFQHIQEVLVIKELKQQGGE